MMITHVASHAARGEPHCRLFQPQSSNLLTLMETRANAERRPIVTRGSGSYGPRLNAPPRKD